MIRVEKRNHEWIRRAARQSTHPLELLGPNHARELEQGVLRRTRSHASKFAYRRARFLGMGENGEQHADWLQELQIFAIRSFRWYYPFRCGTYLDNTVRTTITNRGLSYVKHRTQASRARLVTDENGVSHNMEGSDDLAMMHFTANPHEERDANLRIDLAQLSNSGGALGSLSRFVSSTTSQEKFVGWLRNQYASRVSLDDHDVADAVRISRVPYGHLLSEFLRIERSDVERALVHMRQHVA